MPSKRILYSLVESPIDKLLITVENQKLTAIDFADLHTDIAERPDFELSENNAVIFQTRDWLASYFRGENPDTTELLARSETVETDFQQLVWQELRAIPYGQTCTYKDIAQKVAVKKRVQHMSAQAVGNAVGRNPLAILVGCHRVLGQKNTLTGYRGGIVRKEFLLNLEARGIVND